MCLRPALCIWTEHVSKGPRGPPDTSFGQKNKKRSPSASSLFESDPVLRWSRTNAGRDPRLICQFSVSFQMLCRARNATRNICEVWQAGLVVFRALMASLTLPTEEGTCVNSRRHINAPPLITSLSVRG